MGGESDCTLNCFIPPFYNMWYTVESDDDLTTIYTVCFGVVFLTASFMLISLLYLPSKPFELFGVTECTQLE